MQPTAPHYARPIATITYNALALRPSGTGVQTYVAEILQAVRATSAATLQAVVQADAVDLLPTGVTPLVRRPCNGVRRAIESLRSVGTTDLVHGLDVDLPLRADAPLVSTVHDLSVFDVPWTFSRTRSTGERVLVRRTLQRADAVIAVSSFTAERVRHHLGVDPVVVLEGAPTSRPVPDPERLVDLRRRLSLPDQFAVHVGSVEPRKNLATLAAACRKAALPLVLAGPGTIDAAPGLDAIGLGYVHADDLPLLYAASTVVGYPSIYEGFGLPPLEAMAAGAPVVAADASALPEVLGDGALLQPARDVDAWADALRSVATDERFRGERIAAGHARVACLTWRAAAEGTIAVYAGLGVDAGD